MSTSAQSEKNLHTTIAPVLLKELEQMAEAEHVTVDEIVEQALQRHLRHDTWQELLAFGKKHAQQRGLKPSDVAREIAAHRRETQGRG